MCLKLRNHIILKSSCTASSQRLRFSVNTKHFRHSPASPANMNFHKSWLQDLLVIAQLGAEDKYMHRGKDRSRSCWEKAVLSVPSEMRKP